MEDTYRHAEYKQPPDICSYSSFDRNLRESGALSPLAHAEAVKTQITWYPGPSGEHRQEPHISATSPPPPALAHAEPPL